MTVNELIELVDLKEPNSYSREEKLRWISSLDGKISAEVLFGHEGCPMSGPLAPYESGEEELLVPFPYAEGVYTHYLIAMIAAGNAEAARYNQQIAMYNANYSQWWNAYHAAHTPLHGGSRFLF
jgi:hypothetical protein